jgi:hypothetical protein
MDLAYREKAYEYAKRFESSYDDYDERYKVHNNPTVWRFMSLSDFQGLLENNALFFAKPGAFLDPLEGCSSMWNIEELREKGERHNRTSRTYIRKIHEFSAVSSWHINEYEAAGMWDLYLKGNDGIAIKTTYENLLCSIKDLRYKIFSGKVQYIDFQKEMVSHSVYDTLFYKRKSYQHENELRLVIIASRIHAWKLQKLFEIQGISANQWQKRMYGNLLTCNLHQLINEIYVSPRSAQSCVDKVKALTKKHGLAYKKVIQSDLYKDYIY